MRTDEKRPTLRALSFACTHMSTPLFFSGERETDPGLRFSCAPQREGAGARCRPLSLPLKFSGLLCARKRLCLGRSVSLAEESLGKRPASGARVPLWPGARDSRRPCPACTLPEPRSPGLVSYAGWKWSLGRSGLLRHRPGTVKGRSVAAGMLKRFEFLSCT